MLSGTGKITKTWGKKTIQKHVGTRKVGLMEEQIMLSKVAPLRAVVLRCEATEHIQTALAELVA